MPTIDQHKAWAALQDAGFERDEVHAGHAGLVRIQGHLNRLSRSVCPEALNGGKNVGGFQYFTPENGNDL